MDLLPSPRARPRRVRRAVGFARIAAVALVGTLCAAGEVAAQDARAPGGLGVHLLGGVTAYTDTLHTAAGLSLQYDRGAWGALALATLGSGARYDSRLIGAAATRRLTRLGSVELSAFAGLAHYWEKGPSGIERTAPGPLVGAVAALDVGPLTMSALFSNVFASYGGDDVFESFTFQVPRVHLGVGIR